jgi:ribosome-binding protein aMBF1 (putative translation factor)
MVAETAEKPDRITLNEELTKRVREEAARRGVSDAELVHELLSAQLDEDARYIAAVEEGRRSGETEGWIPMEEVDEELDDLIANARAGRAR